MKHPLHKPSTTFHIDLRSVSICHLWPNGQNVTFKANASLVKDIKIRDMASTLMSLNFGNFAHFDQICEI